MVDYILELNSGMVDFKGRHDCDVNGKPPPPPLSPSHMEKSWQGSGKHLMLPLNIWSFFLNPQVARKNTVVCLKPTFLLLPWKLHHGSGSGGRTESRIHSATSVIILGANFKKMEISFFFFLLRISWLFLISLGPSHCISEYNLVHSMKIK